MSQKYSSTYVQLGYTVSIEQIGLFWKRESDQDETVMSTQRGRWTCLLFQASWICLRSSYAEHTCEVYIAGSIISLRHYWYVQDYQI